MIRLLAGWPGLYSRQGQWWDFVSSPPRPDLLWSPPGILSNGYRWLFPRGLKWPGREADHLQLLPTLRMRGAITPFFQYAWMASCSFEAQWLYLTFISLGIFLFHRVPRNHTDYITTHNFFTKLSHGYQFVARSVSAHTASTCVDASYCIPLWGLAGVMLIASIFLSPSLYPSLRVASLSSSFPQSSL